jgi:uncharacterized protein YcbX
MGRLDLDSKVGRLKEHRMRPWLHALALLGVILVFGASFVLLMPYPRAPGPGPPPRQQAGRATLSRLGANMLMEIGQVEAIFRYPVKSMAGERLEVAQLGWHGLEGDRRLAFRRMDNRSGFPWLTAGKLPDLLLFAPHRREDDAQGELPTQVRTPDGEEMPVFGEDLAREVGRRHGAPVQMMQLNHGIFDEASLSVIASDTVRGIGRLAGRSPDVRRFRPNVVVRLLRPVPFQEDEWVGGVLSFGEGDDAPAITVTMRDVRCSMVALDPDSASPAPEVLKAVVRANQNTAGIYGAVTRIGRLAVGQTLFLVGVAPPSHTP